ncbi:MAG TPA: hypothetical protein VI911_10995 [Patescibacteria group bacterium]|nr:hypothetical protein [Patescibacteria group bacterium]
MFNKQAIIIKQMVDNAREQQEAMKYAFYSIDNSEGAQLLMDNTRSRGFFRARYLNPDALALRNSIFK